MRGAAVLALLTAPALAGDQGAARAAFLKAYPAFIHARCVNCHPTGDRPLQGDDSQPHAQLVKRGADGKGRFAAKCVSCHDTRNRPGLRMPPGAPNWHLPSAQAKLVFEGRKAGELCRQLNDRRHNGGKTLAQILEHVARDPLVAWGWAPGDGRASASGTQAEFAGHVKAWIDNGAACPE